MSTYISQAEQNFTAAQNAAAEAGLSLSISAYLSQGLWIENDGDLTWDDRGRAFIEEYEETICECSDCSDYGGTEECDTFCAYCQGKDFITESIYITSIAYEFGQADDAQRWAAILSEHGIAFEQTTDGRFRLNLA